MRRFLQRRLMWDIGALAILYALIIAAIKPQTPAVFLLMLLSLNLVVIRLRFPRLRRWFLLDVALFLALFFLWSPALYLAMPAVYLLCREGRFTQWIVIPLLMAVTYPRDPWLWGLFTLASLHGSMVFAWHGERTALLNAIDTKRRRLFEMQVERGALLNSQSEISRIATYSERDRIARKLHDDLGHEITAGLLSLKAYQRLCEQGKRDETVLRTAMTRIEQAASALKDTVHNTKPLSSFALEAFEAEIGRFPLTVGFEKHGDITRIAPHHWQVLNAVLKECLTNALKHGTGADVGVTLEVTAQVVRLSVMNDNPFPHDKQGKGYGLTFMRSRIEALGGSLSLQRGMTFTVIAIMPLEEELHEHTAG
mgnify:CR=1 FL=1